MVERIYQVKNQLIDRIEQDLRDRGVERMDVTEMGKLVDMVKDLACAEKECWEADYYRAVTESMDQAQGYTPSQDYTSGNRGYSQNRRSYNRGYMQGNRQGYHGDIMETVRQALSGMEPNEAERMRQQLRNWLDN